jgi:hypothetical protein
MMKMSETPESKTEPEQKPEKLPYEPPAVISEETFEIQALACIKLGASCKPAPSKS